MRKLLVGLLIIVVVPGVVYLAALAKGIINTSSLMMILNVMLGLRGPEADQQTVAQRYEVPPGFSVSLYAADLPRARMLRFTPDGDLLVSRPHAGDILLLRRDRDGDGHPDGIETVVEGLKRPQGMDFAGDWLYVAESDRIGRLRFDSPRGAAVGDYEPVVEGLTDNGNHWSKTLRIGPDGRIYLTQGSSCNVCEEQDARRATMMRFDPDGGGGEIYATGLRNSVGFAWAPWSGDLYATDNGRDLLGDDFPPCELNRIQQGGFYGWPYFNGDNLPDPTMGPDPRAGERQPLAPAHPFRAHTAPLGILFPDTTGWPDRYHRSALVALHGSWNRRSPDGYKIVSLHWSKRGIRERDFLIGFELEGDVVGRPVDIAQGPDGAIYVSDDYAGAVYRIVRGESQGTIDLPPARSTHLDETPPDWLADADLARMAANGKILYEKYQCRSCHEAGESPVSLEGLVERLGYNAVIETLRAPRQPMPVFPLSEDQRRELAVYLLDR